MISADRMRGTRVEHQKHIFLKTMTINEIPFCRDEVGCQWAALKNETLTFQ